jgi:hypothetical protein
MGLDGRGVTDTFRELGEVSPAYAVTVRPASMLLAIALVLDGWSRQDAARGLTEPLGERVVLLGLLLVITALLGFTSRVAGGLMSTTP